MKRKTIFVLLALAMFLTIAFFYLNNIFLPIKLKEIIAQKAKDILHRQVTIDEIHFQPIKGFTLSHIRIYEKNFSEKPFVDIKEMNFNILIPPIFNNKQIVIPSLKISSPIVHLIRENDKEWNFSDLISYKKKDASENSFTLYLGKLNVENGVCDYTDKRPNHSFFESFEGITTHAAFSLSKHINFQLSALVPQRNSTLDLKGRYNLGGLLEGRLLLKDLEIARYADAFPTELPIRINNGAVPSADLYLKFQDDTWDIKGDLAFKNADVLWQENRYVSSDVELKGFEIFRQNGKLLARGHATLEGADLFFAPQKKLKGNITAEVQSFKLSEDSVNISGQLNIHQSHLTMSPTQELAGDIQLKNLNYFRQAGRMALKGDLKITDTDLKLNNKNFRGDLSSPNLSFSQQDSLYSLKGNFLLSKADLKFPPEQSLQGEISLENTDLTWNDLNMDLTGDLKILNTNMNLGNEKKLTGNISAPHTHLTLREDHLVVTTKAQLKNANIQLDKDKRLQGNPQLVLTIENDLSGSSPFLYTGTILLNHDSLSGLPTINETNDLKGKISFRPDQISTDKLTFTAENTSLVLKGTLSNFSEPALNITLATDKLDLAKLLTLFPPWREKFSEITGEASLDLIYKGLLKTPAEAKISLSSELRNADVKTAVLPDKVTGISGNLTYIDHLLSWKNLKMTYQKKTYLSEGTLKNPERPVLKTSLSSKDFSLVTEINFLDNIFRIVSLKGNYLETSFDLSGDIKKGKNDSSDLDLKGKVQLSLSDVKFLVPQLKEKLLSIKPRGVMTLAGTLRGPKDNWRDWDIDLTGGAQRIFILTHPLADVNFQYKQNNQKVSVCNLSAELYDGKLDLITSADLKQENIPLHVDGRLTTLDLTKVRWDKEKNEKEENKLAGLLTIFMNINGPLLKMDDLQGAGSLNITEGHIWQWNILQGILGALLIPEFKQVIFTDGRSNFTIRDNKIYTENAELISKTVTLRGKGSVDFKKNINFDVTPNFSEIAILESNSLFKKGPTSLLTQAFTIKLTGTLDDPEYKVSTSPLKVIEKTTDMLKDGVEGIFQEIF